MGESNAPHTKEEGPSALSDSAREAGTGAPPPLGRWGARAASARARNTLLEKMTGWHE